jgi:hypothetical protein
VAAGGDRYGLVTTKRKLVLKFVSLCGSYQPRMHSKCASCRHSSGCETGNPFCHLWGTILLSSWHLIEICPIGCPGEPANKRRNSINCCLPPMDILENGYCGFIATG